MELYEWRDALMSLHVNKAAAGYQEIGKGERLTVSGLGTSDGVFTVDDVSEPDENGAITLTLTEIR